MPVLPDDGSRRTCPGSPGRRTPDFSASSIIERAMRSFTEPPGFWPSSLRRMRTSGLGLSGETSTSGVLPIRSRTLWTTATVCGRPSGSAGDGGKDRDRVAVDDLGPELVEVPHVVVVHVDVDETVQLALVGEHLPGHAGVRLLQVGEHLAD